MNYEDRVTKEYIESALAGTGVKIATGTYYGNGSGTATTTTHVNLGFQPKAVFVGGSNNQLKNGGFAMLGYPTICEIGMEVLRVTSDGFDAIFPGNSYLPNLNGSDRYCYLAIG